MSSEKLKEWGILFKDIGFPVFIALYLIIRQDRLLVEIINLLTKLNGG